MGSTYDVGGNINIVASTSTWNQRSYNYNFNYNYNYNYDNEATSREVNFGFDEVSDDSTTQRQISLQLKSSKNSTRLISTVPIQVTTIQYSSDERIKKDIRGVNTGELLDRMRQIQLREYGESNESSFFMSFSTSSNFLIQTNLFSGYTDEWRLSRGLEANDVRVRGVIAQELRKIFPEHIEILDELTMKGKGTTLKNFHQVDKQALLMDLIGAFQAHTDHFITRKLSSDAVTRSVAVSTAGVDRSSAENESGSTTISTGDASNGKSGNILLKGGDGYQTGNIDVMIGQGSSWLVL